MVIEPPCGALLNLAREFLLEAADNGSDGSVVVGIQGVQDGLWNLVVGAQCI